MTIRVALVGGPMYDHLYDVFAPDEVEVVIHADHPTLNRRVAEILGGGGSLDLISTHSKYAPSQAQWLRPLDDLIAPATLEALAPRALDLCRFGAQLLCIPRLIDVRVLWARTDRIATVPDSWAALAAGSTVFGFPGRESGLFGTFFELVTGAGGSLFDTSGRPTMASPEAEEAIRLLCLLASRAPADLPDWHYDDVDRALLDGRIDAAGAWPGAWGAIRRSPLNAVLEPHLYPTGSRRRVSYAGCHAWGIPRASTNPDAALRLLGRLAGRDAQSRDASGGNIPAHLQALADVDPANDQDRRRLEITRATIAEAMITYPPHPRFPAIEDAGWAALRDALRGRTTPKSAAAAIQAHAERIISQPNSQSIS